MTRIRTLIATAIVLPAAAGLGGCSEKAEPPPPVRPVLSIVVAPRADQVLGFTGTVEPRYRVSLGFRVLGRLVAREVEVGDQVKAGARLAAIDPLALELAVRSAEADVFKAEAQSANASGVESRQRILLRQNTATPAEFEAAQQGRQTSVATLRRAEANLAKAREQLGYAELRSDMDGVVTAIGAEVGQVVSAGQMVATIARPTIREAAFDVPEDVAREVAAGTGFDVFLQLDPKVRAAARVREIAPQADATTRTRRVLATLVDPPDAFRLGTTIRATLVKPAEASIELPTSAILRTDGQAKVWVVDPAAKTVSQRAVTLAVGDFPGARVVGGLSVGDRVVTAGVNSLSPGQSVRIGDEGVR